MRARHLTPVLYVALALAVAWMAASAVLTLLGRVTVEGVTVVASTNPVVTTLGVVWVVLFCLALRRLLPPIPHVRGAQRKRDIRLYKQAERLIGQMQRGRWYVVDGAVVLCSTGTRWRPSVARCIPDRDAPPTESSVGEVAAERLTLSPTPPGVFRTVCAVGVTLADIAQDSPITVPATPPAWRHPAAWRLSVRTGVGYLAGDGLAELVAQLEGIVPVEQ